MAKRYTDEQILQGLKNLAHELGRTPTTSDIAEASKDDKCVSGRTFILRFGSYNAAVAAAGLVPNPPRRIYYSKKYSDKQLIEQLKSLQKFLNRTPTIKDVETNCAGLRMASASTIVHQFGSFTNALKAAGFEDIFARSKMADKEEEVFVFLCDVAQYTDGKLRSIAQLNKLADSHMYGCQASSLEDHFGSVEEAFAAAGFTVVVLSRRERLDAYLEIARCEYIAALQTYVAAYNYIPSVKDIQRAFREDRFPLSYRTAYRLFGSWPKTLEAAGFDHTRVLVRPGRPKKS